MLYVLLKHLLLICLKKFIRTNKLSLSIETQMHVACFVKTLIVILSKLYVACFVKILIVTLSKTNYSNEVVISMMQQYSCKILLKYSRRVVYLKMLKKGVIYACRLQTLIDPRSSLWCVCVYIYIYIYASALYFYWIQSGYKSLCSLFNIIIISNLICICCFLKVGSSKWRKPVVF